MGYHYAGKKGVFSLPSLFKIRKIDAICITTYF